MSVNVYENGKLKQIAGNASGSNDASGIIYDSNKSELNADNVQGAIDAIAKPAFASDDALYPVSYTNVELLKSGEKLSSILNKISSMFKNVRYLWKMLGNSDISKIGDGTLTGSILALSEKIDDINSDIPYKVNISYDEDGNQRMDVDDSVRD